MEFESQEIFEFSPFNGQINWFKSDANSNCNTWNQNMTEEMMNSYHSVPNFNPDMYYHHHHHHHSQQNQQSTSSQQYEYYEQHTYFHPPENHHPNVSLHQNYDYPGIMQHSVESCDSLIDDQPSMSYHPTPNMLNAQYGQLSSNIKHNHDQENLPKPCFYCTICNMKFSRLYHLKRHFESGTHKTTVRENNIDDPAESLLQFYKQPKESQKYECQMCSKKYKNKISLKRHLTVHTGLKNVLWCQFNTTRRSHTSSETGVCCAIDCSTA